MSWLALTLEVEAAVAEALGDALLDAGAHSVSMDPPAQHRQRLCALLDREADPRALLGAAARSIDIPPPAGCACLLEDQDWVKRSQAQFAPLRVGERLWIGASWHQPPADAAVALRLDPGRAFGTGSHASTRLALRFLDARIRGGERVLDYGCGSGILAIAAAKLGAARVDALDIDPDALAATAENARLNDVDVRAFAPDALGPASYDIVVSNILAQPLILLAPLLAARTARAGRIALSGILAAQSAEVGAAYAPWFEMAACGPEQGWALLEGARR
ncbi:MAG TPA: 50S ribosomal protein L11 methyltransferase [Burkholderiales bacterium]|jgi:ribosomal protein L11 methyltransferase|nr:50S ribosomal protein L11 methyltransferase [Burkholderiales bacterium]